MTELLDLWLPIVASAVAVFFTSFISWMVLPFHHKEWGGVPDESGFLQTLRRMEIPPGLYCFPHCPDPSQMKDPEVRKRLNEPPVGLLHLWSHRRSMPMCLLGSFLVNLVVSVFVAYLAAAALAPGAGFAGVFQVAGAAGVLAYAFATIPNNIWFGKPVKSIMLDTADGVAYGLVTGLVFALLWPAAPNVADVLSALH